MRRRHSSEIDLSNRSRDLPELKTMICKQTLTYCHVPVDQRNEITSRSYSNKTKRSKLNSFKRHRTRKSRWRTFWFCVWFVSHDDCMLMAGVFSLSGVSIYKVIIFSNKKRLDNWAKLIQLKLSLTVLRKTDGQLCSSLSEKQKDAYYWSGSRETLKVSKRL